jgi:hypothetical protein
MRLPGPKNPKNWQNLRRVAKLWLAAAQRRRKSRGPQNRRPIDKHYETIGTAMQAVFDELGLAA